MTCLSLAHIGLHGTRYSPACVRALSLQLTPIYAECGEIRYGIESRDICVNVKRFYVCGACCVQCVVCCVGKIKFRYSVAVWKFSRRRCLPFVSSCALCVDCARFTRCRCRCRCRCVCKLQVNNPLTPQPPLHYECCCPHALAAAAVAVVVANAVAATHPTDTFACAFEFVFNSATSCYGCRRVISVSDNNKTTTKNIFKKKEPNQTFELLHILTLITRWIKLLKH